MHKIIITTLLLTIVLVPTAMSRQKTKLTGRVLAVSDWPVTNPLLLRGFPHAQEFIFGMETKDGRSGKEAVVPIYVSYEYYPGSEKLPENFFDYSKKYELSVIKENLDFFLEEVAYGRFNVSDEGGDRSSYIDKQWPRLKILDGVPESILRIDMDITLPRYKLATIKYKIIKERSRK